MKSLLLGVALAIAVAPLARAQESAEPQTVRVLEGNDRDMRPVNVRFDFVITEEGSAIEVSEQRVSLVAGNMGRGSSRSISMTLPEEGVAAPPPLFNIDVGTAAGGAVQVLTNGTIRASVVIQYQPYAPGVSRPWPAGLELLALRSFKTGVRTLVAQTADPALDRQTTVEVTATILDE